MPLTVHFHSRTYGSGHPLIVLHGLFGSLDNWATPCKRLGEYFHVFAFDARNHGRSFHSSELSYTAMANDVRDFMQMERIDSAFILGHSMGGKTAMLFASLFPALVDRLIVVDISPKEYDRKHDIIMDALAGIELTRYHDRMEVDQALATRIPEIATRQFLMKNLSRDESGGFRWKMNLRIIRSHYDEIMKGLPSTTQFGKPTLFIRGGKSTYVSDEDMLEVKQMFPRSTLLTIEKAGHWVHADAPDEMHKAIVRFLTAS